MLVYGPTNVCALNPVITLWVVRCFSVGHTFLFSSNVDRVDVVRRIGRCFARHETVRNSPLNGGTQLEWSTADVPRRLWSFPGTTMV